MFDFFFWRRLAETLTFVILADFMCVFCVKCLNFYDRLSDTTRWLQLHAVVNWVITMLTIPAFLAFIQEPGNAMIVDSSTILQIADDLWHPCSKYPMTLVVALHVYHIIGPFRLSEADWFHHLLFITFLAIPGAIYHWGVLANWFAFFACGLPGAIDYTLLCFQKGDVLSWVPQKQVSSWMNTWIRAPGILMGASIGYVFLVSQKYNVPRWALVLQLFLLPFNAIYYNRQATVNFVIHEFRRIADEDAWQHLRRTLR